MGGQRRPHPLGVRLPPTGRTLDIGEQKRHYARRRMPWGHLHRMSHKPTSTLPTETNFRDSHISSYLRHGGYASRPIAIMALPPLMPYGPIWIGRTIM